MREGRVSSRVWAAGLWVALLAGILVAWSPRYWAVSVAITSLSLVGIGRALTGIDRVAGLPWQTVPVVAIGGWGFVQMALHTTVLPELTLNSSLVWSMSAVAFVLGALLLRNGGTREFFLELLLWSVTILAVIAMLQYYSAPVRVFGIFPAAVTVVGTFISGNQFAALMEIGAPVALWYMVDRNPLPGGLCYAMILAATITAGSRAGVALLFAELAVFLGTIVFARGRDTRAIVSILGGLALLVGVAAAIAGTDQIRLRFEDKKVYAVRRELLDSTLQLIAERPGTGWGMGTWRAVYPHTATFDMAVLANEAHNDWAQWASEGGIPFAILMGGLVVWIAGPAARSIWGLGLLSVMVHSYVDYPTREPALAFLWFAMAGGVTAGSQENAEVKQRG